MFRRTVEPGVELRQFVPADAEEAFAAVERNRDYLRQWMPWTDRTQTADDVREFIERAQAQDDANEGPQMGLWIDGVFGGSLGCHTIDWANRNCSIGYWLDQQQQGKGLITRCCAVLLDYLFDELGLHRVEIRCGTGNTRSCAIPERLGFTREGVLRQAERINDRWLDLVVWSILEAEWRDRKRG
jgi:ribosomal-protein-serine acetyltransferase